MTHTWRVALACIAASLSSWMGPSAHAAVSHQNTDPYSTGCARDGYAFAAKAVPGGTVRVFVSPRCGTNWFEYQGTSQAVAKGIRSSYGTARTEVDTGTWSYSMQVYAPGATAKVTLWVQGGAPGAPVSQTWRYSATCSATCSWGTF